MTYQRNERYEYKEDKKFLRFKKDSTFHNKSRFLKIFYEIIQSEALQSAPWNTGINTKDPYLLILARRREPLGEEIKNYAQELIYLLKRDIKKKNAELKNSSDAQKKFQLLDQCIEANTVHSIKGRQAHNVIIMDAHNRSFPLIHPNEELNAIFFENAKDYYFQSVAEQRRLYYVAVTRAIDNLFLITEKGKEINFKPNV